MKPLEAMRWLLLFALLAVAACQGGPTINAQNAEAFTYAFVAGRVELSSDNPLTLPSPWYRRRVYALWRSGQWANLAADVAENGFDMDINWFYLGESAKAQGFNDAARAYYRRAYNDSISSFGNRRCASFLHIDHTFCAGFRFPQDVLLRMP